MYKEIPELAKEILMNPAYQNYQKQLELNEDELTKGIAEAKGMIDLLWTEENRFVRLKQAISSIHENLHFPILFSLWKYINFKVVNDDGAGIDFKDFIMKYNEV
ncbi:hypothetical protein D3C75_1018760 [compost metagenome]